MAGGRAREIARRREPVGQIVFASEHVRHLLEAVLDRFSALASEEDAMNVATYESDGYAYLDICRHRRGFPPVEKVSVFGEYQLAEQAIRARPTDVFLKHVAEGVCYYAYDRVGATPGYLSFRFPVSDIRRKSSEGKGSSEVRILAIDDQPVILDLISAMCQSMGYTVDTAQSGEAGLKLAATGRYDVILTDLAMPDMSGLAVARQVHRLHSDTPIVLITGWETGVDKAQLDESGITQVLYKPFRIEQLTDAVRSATIRSARH
jgi:CheY-like chemotaxis protein